MPYKVVISERAEKNLDALLIYLEKEWSVKVKNDFIDKLVRKINFISKMPFMYPESKKKKGVRRCLVSRHNALYYRVSNKEIIEIITIRDTRSDPDKFQL